MSQAPEHKSATVVAKIGEYRKAIAAVLVPGLVVLGAALLAGSEGGSVVTAAEWVGIAIAALGTGGTVALVSNRPYTG